MKARLYVVLLMSLSFGCTTNMATDPATPAPTARTALFRYGLFQDQVTGITISSQGRIFVNFPRWDKAPRYSVAEVLADGSYRPFPDAAWNSWGTAEADHPEAHFICIQSVVVDDKDFLWAVDAASPGFKGVINGGAKLVRFNLADGSTDRVIAFNKDMAPAKSYLNDLRVDTAKGFAYVTDSGLGAIIVIDLNHGTMRRVLAADPSTKAEPGFVPVIDGHQLRDAKGTVPQINADGIALDSSTGYLYYHALTGTTLYRIHTRYLNDFSVPETELAARIEKVAETGAVDGMESDGKGNLYFTALEDNAIKKWQPTGKIVTVVSDPAVHWPDSIALSPDEYLYFTDSQINLSPRFNKGKDRHSGPYGFFKIWLVPFQGQ